jgi:hypothetical protein
MMHSTFAENLSHRKRLADVRCWRIVLKNSAVETEGFR